MKLICGLGNPGKKYEHTRHNVGFDFLDVLARDHEFPPFAEKWNALASEAVVAGEKWLLIKPTTYMNLSGEAVLKFQSFYKLAPEDLCVVYDDVDLPVGEFRFRAEGSPGTHNGMRSILSLLGTQKVPRIRFGIESRGDLTAEQIPLADFVLTPFTSEGQKRLSTAFEQALEEIKKNGLP